MFKLIISLCLLHLALGEDPLITLPNGQIRGKVVTSPVNKDFSYYAYQGIPFAAPPVGNLRFKPPQPVENWEGVKDVRNKEVSCFQTDREEAHASEDCLYLSVFTPVGPTNKTKLHVLVFIYGGTFIHGHLEYGYQKPAFLMEEDVIMVSFNYRVGPFGFLSTGDAVIAGNMGLKDQQFALKWVQQNIHLFGGDPEKVTLMGQSAGSASVTYQILAPGSAGLFRAAIGCSGSALCTWAQQRDAAENAYGIATEIDPNFTRNRSSEELLQFLQSVDAKAIHLTYNKYKVFAPVIEVPHDGAIISEVMYDSAENGNFNRVPVLMGINSEESIANGADMDSWKKSCSRYDRSPDLLVDADMKISDKQEKIQIGKEIRDIYVPNGSFESNPGKGIQFNSDNRFARAIIKFAELASKHVDLYFYQFSYHGKLGGNTVVIDGIGKVAHAEDQKYFWAQTGGYSQFPAADVLTLRRYNRLLTNFIKHLNPTPVEDDLLQNLTWPTVTDDGFHYFDIDSELTIQENPRNFSFSRWVDIYEKYVEKPYISY